jgi:hypothetical protein
MWPYTPLIFGAIFRGSTVKGICSTIATTISTFSYGVITIKQVKILVVEVL